MNRAAVVAAVMAVVLAVAVPAAALYGAAKSVTSNTISTATLQAPAGLSAAPGCDALSPKVTLDWDATSSTFADGYDVYRGTASGGPYALIAHVNARATVAYSNTALEASTIYFYVLRATAVEWTSANSNEAQATTGIC